MVPFYASPCRWFWGEWLLGQPGRLMHDVFNRLQSVDIFLMKTVQVVYSGRAGIKRWTFGVGIGWDHTMLKMDLEHWRTHHSQSKDPSTTLQTTTFYIRITNLAFQNVQARFLITHHICACRHGIVLYCIVYKFLKWPKYKPQGPLGIDIISSRLLSRKR